MTDSSTSGPDRNVFAVFRHTVRSAEIHVKAAAAFALLFCLLCAMGLGGAVLPSQTDAVNFWFGTEWSPDRLSLAARFTLAAVWVVTFSLGFLYLLPAGFWQLPLPTPRA